MAFDYGAKAIGVALSDELRLTARPLTTVRRAKQSEAQVFARLTALVIEHEPGLLLIGLPLNMDGTRGPAVERVERFVERLGHSVSVPMQMIDERLTSRAADEMLRASGANERERRAKSDEYAALILLRDFLEEQAAPQDYAQRDYAQQDFE